jgi:hypothetical protein
MPRLQPLPLTLFERYLFHEDRRAHPCWLVLRFRFRGSFEKIELQSAWERTAARHPLLTAVVRRGGLGQLRWEPAADFRPCVQWVPERQPSGWPHLPEFDLMRTPAFHLFAWQSDGYAELCTHALHAVYDGAGAFAVMDELLIHYARELGDEVALPVLEPQRLPKRNRFGLSLWNMVRLAPAQALGLAISLQLQRRTVEPLTRQNSAPDEDPLPAGAPAMARRQLSPQEFGEYRAAAKRLGTGLYDLLIRDAQAALGVWFKSQGKADPLAWSRLVVPTNLRRPSDATLPCTNIVSMVIIDRRVKSLANRARLLQRAREDMGWIRRKRWGYVFLILLGIYRFLPGGIRGYCRKRVCRATLLLSNVGQAFASSPLLGPDGRVAVPGATLEEIAFGAPLRPGTSAGFIVGVYGQGLWADLTYDPRVLPAEQADALADAFAEQIRLSIQSDR